MSFLRQLWKQKVEAWGPVSEVQASLFKNAEAIGIDADLIEVACPCWESTGGTVYDYSKNKLKFIQTTPSWKQGGLYAQGSYATRALVANSTGLVGNVPITVFAASEKLGSGTNFEGVFAVGNATTSAGVYVGQIAGNLYGGGTYGVSNLSSLATAVQKQTVTQCYKYDKQNEDYFLNGQHKASRPYTSLNLSTSGISLGAIVASAFLYNGIVLSAIAFKAAIPNNKILLLNDTWKGLWQRVAPVSYFIPGSTPGGLTLSLANLAQSHSIDAVALTQKHNLDPESLTQTQNLAATSLTQKHFITAADLSQAMTLETPTLSMASALIVQALNHVHTLENIGVIQKHNLIVDGLSHTQTMGGVVLEIAGLLTVASLLQSQGIGNADLTQAHALAVASLNQAQDLGSVNLALQLILEVAGLSHDQSLDGVSVSSTTVLTVNNLGHIQDLGSMTLAQATSLLVNDLQHNQNLTAVSFVSATGKVTVSFSMACPGVSFSMATPTTKIEME